MNTKGKTARDGDNADATTVAAIELVDLRETCRLLGGSRPIHPATLYRGIANGRFPRPLKISRAASRWIKSELIAVVHRCIAERDGEAA